MQNTVPNTMSLPCTCTRLKTKFKQNIYEVNTRFDPGYKNIIHLPNIE